VELIKFSQTHLSDHFADCPIQFVLPMSAFGAKQTSAGRSPMSALLPFAETSIENKTARPTALSAAPDATH
jgi:hypothetical protein